MAGRSSSAAVLASSSSAAPVTRNVSFPDGFLRSADHSRRGQFVCFCGHLRSEVQSEFFDGILVHSRDLVGHVELLFDALLHPQLLLLDAAAPAEDLREVPGRAELASAGELRCLRWLFVLGFRRKVRRFRWQCEAGRAAKQGRARNLKAGNRVFGPLRFLSQLLQFGDSFFKPLDGCGIPCRTEPLPLLLRLVEIVLQLLDLLQPGFFDGANRVNRRADGRQRSRWRSLLRRRPHSRL